MTTPTPAPPDGDPKREVRNRGLKLRKLAERLRYDARQASGAWRIFVMRAGDRQRRRALPVDGAAALAVHLRPTRHETP